MCEDGSEPSDEVCDEVDNDCNGEVDDALEEDCPGGCIEGVCRECELDGRACLTSSIVGVCSLDGEWIQSVCDIGCNDISLNCNTCVPDASECQDNVTEVRCKLDGTGEQQTTCEFGCSNGRCNTCTPNSRDCVDDDTETVCRSDGSGSDEVECTAGFGCTDGYGCNTCEPSSCYCSSANNMAQCSSLGRPSGGYSCSSRGAGVTCDASLGHCSDGFSWCN